MPKIIGKAATVVEEGGLKIDELAGNVATSEDTISIASVTISSPTNEPWLTLKYDEWLCVTSGCMLINYYENDEKKQLKVNAGETCFVAKNERFQPEFPIVPTSYIPVCLPAFRPDRCIREEGNEESDISLNLKKLHKVENDKSEEPMMCVVNEVISTEVPDQDVLYHMCQKNLWEEAVVKKTAYYPPTFEQDGNFTHATNVPQRLVDTANHFYTSTKGDWICLQLSRSALSNIGIVTVDEGGLPVGDTEVSDQIKENKWVCPHIYAGLPTTVDGVLTKVYDMMRDEEGNFMYISGLTD